MTEIQVNNNKWYAGLLTPQTFFYLLAGMVAIVIFWTKTQDSWAKLKEQEKQMEAKADRADLKALEDRVTRQYETNNKVLDRIIILEKAQEYQRGIHDAQQNPK